MVGKSEEQQQRGKQKKYLNSVTAVCSLLIAVTLCVIAFTFIFSKRLVFVEIGKVRSFEMKWKLYKLIFIMFKIIVFSAFCFVMYLVKFAVNIWRKLSIASRVFRLRKFEKACKLRYL
jgi:hypothetical protein